MDPVDPDPASDPDPQRCFSGSYPANKRRVLCFVSIKEAPKDVPTLRKSVHLVQAESSLVFLNPFVPLVDPDSLQGFKVLGIKNRNNFYSIISKVESCGFRKLSRSSICKLKGTVSRDFLLLVFFMNQFPPRPRVIR